jgi:hypothetical protein|nr:MAG TPA: hypothetical protein [Caudoviricetes sp.]
MKRIVFEPKAKCRACEFNDYKNTGADYCIRAGCKYKISEKKEEGEVPCLKENIKNG